MTNDSSRLHMLYRLGRPLAPVYGNLMRLRAACYHHHILSQQRLGVPVISVGNLAVGGSGKTPMVRYLVGLLQQQGHHPAIISRGYGGTAGNGVNVVADNTGVWLDAATGGDEPVLLAKSLPGVPVITAKSRGAAGQYAIDRCGADTIVMDDGFQHLRLRRDLDLVLFHGPSLAAPAYLTNSRVLPGGELREMPAALKRAHGLVITATQEMSPAAIDTARAALRRVAEKTPIFISRTGPAPVLRQFLAVTPEERLPIATAQEQPVYGFCGIARPQSFKKSLEAAGFTLRGFTAFEDHVRYSLDDINTLWQRARSCKAKALITTEKDGVKLRSLLPPRVVLLQFDLDLVLTPEFDRFVIDFLAAAPDPSRSEA